MILETGIVQPEALGLYRSSGYQDVPAFGRCAGYPLSVRLGKQLVAILDHKSASRWPGGESSYVAVSGYRPRCRC